MDFSTDPIRADTDGDDLADNSEVTLGTNPAAVDTDGDGIWDLDEVRRNTASAPDTDHDGCPNWLVYNKMFDTDGDGLSPTMR